MPNSSAFLYGATIATNSDGFRDYEYSIEKGNGTLRILVLGDSITLGWGIDLDSTYTKILERKLNQLKPFKKYGKYDVINTGIGNYNTAMELVLLKDKGMKYNPDLIILEYYINDAEITPKKPVFDILRHSYLYAFLWDKYINTRVRFFENNNYRYYYKGLYKNDTPGKETARKSILELIRISKEKKIRLLIVIFPEFHNFKNYEFNEVTEFVSKIAKSENTSYLDLLPYYTNQKPEDIWITYEDAHPNKLGNTIAAEAIYKELLNYLAK